MIHDVNHFSAQRRRALVEQDFDLLSSLLSSDLRYVHATGLAHGKDAYLSFASDAIRFLQVNLVSPTLKMLGDGAAISGILEQKILRKGACDAANVSSWAIEVWKRHDGGWVLTDFQSTRRPA